MDTNEKFVITINREMGSGGRTVGEILAEKLGVPFYDKAVVKALTGKYNLSVESIERLKGLRHDWWSEFKRNMGIGQKMINAPEYYRSVMGEEPVMLTTDEMFEAESEIIKGMAAEESCIIAGRLGFAVLKDHPNRLSILIQAPMEHRIERIMTKQGLSREEASEAINKVDKMRENYVNFYAHTSRYDARNYDLVINMAGKTEDEVADLILKYIKG